ncbi:hypothetical protein [Novosphingobium lindaniclasticum]|uniref:hypothetical protein n=1 Tax=Novosphingobium lindaniclasticum TaxID=1329895 RepID=UPI0012688034|nr:hypothetical protein [Novosphingobium lindaniclasticum]
MIQRIVPRGLPATAWPPAWVAGPSRAPAEVFAGGLAKAGKTARIQDGARTGAGRCIDLEPETWAVPVLGARPLGRIAVQPGRDTASQGFAAIACPTMFDEVSVDVRHRRSSP